MAKQKQQRTINDIVLNLKLRRVIEDLVNCVNIRGSVIESENLLKELNGLRFKNVEYLIPQKSPNISNEATESFVCYLISKRLILKEISHINSIERRGNKKGTDGGADIIVNGSIKIEVKGTSVKRDITTKSKSNHDVYALIWVETEDWMRHKSSCIKIKIFYNPHGIETEYLQSNNENKIRLSKSFEKAKENGLTEEISINPETLIEYQSEFFGSNEIEVMPPIAH